MPTSIMKTLRCLRLLVLSLGLPGGCATIMSQSQWPVTLHSRPEGAEVQVVNAGGQLVYAGITPASISLTSKRAYFRGEVYQVTFSKAGYAPCTVELATRMNGWYLFNVPFGIFGFLIIDPVTGAMYRLDSAVTAEMVPAAVMSTGTQTVSIAWLEEVPEAIRPQLQKVATSD